MPSSTLLAATSSRGAPATAPVVSSSVAAPRLAAAWGHQVLMMKVRCAQQMVQLSRESAGSVGQHLRGMA